MTDDESAIREMIATWLRASAEGDSAKVLALMADDVEFLVAGQRPFGKEEFASALSGLLAFQMEATSHVREVCVVADMAYAVTHLVVSITPRSGGPTTRRSGSTLSIFRRAADGRWLLSRDANLLTPEI
jgi:uncharacterized protein (TIGR02246 family)